MKWNFADGRALLKDNVTGEASRKPGRLAQIPVAILEKYVLCETLASCVFINNYDNLPYVNMHLCDLMLCSCTITFVKCQSRRLPSLFMLTCHLFS